jgi:hypothetical protein
MSSGESCEMDFQFVVSKNQFASMSDSTNAQKMKSLRKRKRPTCSQIGSLQDEALDWPPSGCSAVIEPSLVPPIVTLTPTRTTPAAQVRLLIEGLPTFFQQNPCQDSVTVDGFIRQVTAEVPGPDRKRNILTWNLRSTHDILSLGSAFITMRPATGAARKKIYSRNERRVTKTPIKERKPMTLTQRLTRAAILSHVKTDDILHSPAVTSSRPPLDFVSFQKFATPPSSRRRTALPRGDSSSEVRSHFLSSAAPRRRNGYKGLTPILQQPGFERSGCLPLAFIPLREAEDAYAAKFL